MSRYRWLWALLVAAVVLAWFTGPLMWAFAVIVLVLAVKNEWVIHQGRRTTQA